MIKSQKTQIHHSRTLLTAKEHKQKLVNENRKHSSAFNSQEVKDQMDFILKNLAQKERKTHKDPKTQRRRLVTADHKTKEVTEEQRDCTVSQQSDSFPEQNYSSQVSKYQCKSGMLRIKSHKNILKISNKVLMI